MATKIRYIILIFAFGLAGQLRAELSPAQQEFQDSLRAKVPELNGLTGITLSPEDIYVFDGQAELEGPADERTTDEAVSADILSWTVEAAETDDRLLGIALEVNRTVIREGSRDVVHWEQNDRGNACLIFFPANGLALTGREKESIIYHELFHCYQYQAFGGSPFRTFPTWFTEGTAHWAGEQLSGGSNLGTERFEEYLSPDRNMPLFERDYDAFPFFSHLAAWTAPETVFADFRRWVSATSRNIFSAAVSSDPNTLVRSWSAGIWRAMQNGHPDWGPEWNTDVPASPSVSSVFHQEEVRGTRTVSLYPHLPAHFQFHPDSEKFYKITFNDAWGRIRITKIDGTVDDIPIEGGRLSLKLCQGLLCQCPSGSIPLDDDQIIRVIMGDSPISIAVVAQENRGEVKFEEVDPTCCGEGLIDPRLVGTWELDERQASLLPWFDRDICDESVRGVHTLRIDPFGRVTKTYGGFQMRQVCVFSETLIVVTVNSVNGTVTGCLTPGAERTFEGIPIRDIDFLQVTDAVNAFRTVDGEVVPSIWNGEPFFLQFGPFDESESDQFGIVGFRDDEISEISFVKWFPGEGKRLYHRITD